MANELATQKTATELLVQAADELSGGSMGQILKFSKGKYFVGDKEIAVNSELIAHVTQLARGWVKFKGGELVDRRIGKVVDGFVVPERDALDATDKGEWEKDDRGDPRDPWVAQVYLPLEHPETGELIVFVTGSVGGRGAVGGLVQTGSRSLHKGMPIIQLSIRAYKHKQYGRIENPDFPIVGWTGAIPSVSGAPTMHPAFDDTVPF